MRHVGGALAAKFKRGNKKRTAPVFYKDQRTALKSLLVQSHSYQTQKLFPNHDLAVSYLIDNGFEIERSSKPDKVIHHRRMSSLGSIKERSLLAGMDKDKNPCVRLL